MSLTLDEARAIAHEVHALQTDKIGEPYMGHVTAVAAGLTDFDLDLQVAGMLHDVVEDSFEQIGRQVTINELRDRGVSERSLAAIVPVSSNLHPPGDTYLDKIARICTSPDATLVKISDNAHNSLAERVSRLGRAADPKYAAARRLLLSAAPRHEVELILARVNPQLLSELTT